MGIKEDIEKLGKKKLVIIIIGIIIIFVVGFTAISLISSEPIKIINMNEDTYNNTHKSNATPFYYYSVKGLILNLPIQTNLFDDYISNDNLKDYTIIGEFYDVNGKLVYRDLNPSLEKKEKGLEFTVSYSFQGEAVNMSKVVITITDIKNGEIVCKDTYNFIGAVDSVNKSDNTNNTSDSSGDDNSDSNSSSSSKTTGTFDDGFRDGVNDAHDGKFARYTYDTVNSWDNNDYQQGYADGYASYGRNPHLYQDLIR
jgi:hypothetical protein